MKKQLIALIIILLLAAFLRFYRLGEVPAGFHRDEAFLGYNAYSILQTAKDISGNFLPIHLQSFIYSPAGYSYFSIPFIKIFDLNTFSVRFPSALFGTLTVLLTYFLSKRLFPQLNTKYHILATLLLAISPWHINLSRVATENTIVVFFIALGVLFYLLWLEKEKLGWIILSFLSFGITLTIYQAPRAFLPLFIPFMVMVLYHKRLWGKKLLMIGGLFLMTIIIPLFLILRSPEISLRLRTVSIFYTPETQLVLDEQSREDGVLGVGARESRFFHNKIIGYSQQFLKNYFSHFTYNFLFTDAGLPIRYKVPGAGLLYFFELPFILLGIWFLLKNYFKTGIFLAGWVFLTFIGAALTFDDVPNLQRTLIVFPALSIISGSGFYIILSNINKIRIIFFRFLIVILTFAFCLLNLVYYLHQYYIHQLNHQPWYRHEGYGDLVKNVNQFLPKFKKVIITDSESAPTVFFLFFGKYDPARFQKETAKLVNKRDLDRVNFNQYQFTDKACPLRETLVKDLTGQILKVIVEGEKKVLYVNRGDCDSLVKAKELKVVNRGDRTAVFRIMIP